MTERKMKEIQEFGRLSLRDIVEARDLFHVHLMNKDNVVATAVGKYRVREEQVKDGFITSVRPSGQKRGKKREPKRLDNTVVAENSWPCLLVFVKQWIYGLEKRTYDSSEGRVPGRLYMPDGRIIPVCTILVEKAERDTASGPALGTLRFPVNMIGGGYPLLARIQGQDRIASIGCLVTDGTRFYALTNRHVTGESGVPIYSSFGGSLRQIGTSSGKAIGSIPFDHAYPGWGCRNTWINADVGLIEVSDANRWTTGIVNIGDPAAMLDLNMQTMSLDLIGREVKAFGCVSGLVTGQIDALFYRYRAVGGFEYVSDFLIGPRSKDEHFAVGHGDSGTLLLVDRPASSSEAGHEWRPFAILWGRHRYEDRQGKHADAYGLATCLATVCRMLEVDIVRDWGLDLAPIWGKVGHFGTSNWAIKHMTAANTPKKLRQLMQLNLSNITLDSIDMPLDSSNKPYYEYCPLADVPDVVWKQNAYGLAAAEQGGSTSGKGKRSSAENVNHHADLDVEANGDTLAELFEDRATLDPKTWDDFYEAAGVKASNRGALPFRVWQLFDAMVEAIKAGNTLDFVCVGGVLAHYVGDACMILHASHHFDGFEDGQGKGVHHFYEDVLIGNHLQEIQQKIEGAIAKEEKQDKPSAPITTGRQAGEAAMGLMVGAISAIPPRKLIDSYIEYKSQGTELDEGMWADYGSPTITVLARGCWLLHRLWTSAWKIGNGNKKIATSAVVALDREDIKGRIVDTNFVRSQTLKNLPGVLSG